MNSKKIIFFIFLIFFLFSCSAENKKIEIFIEKQSSNSVAPEKNKTQKITVELAISPQEQQQGFMDRKVIPEGTGMIFLYKQDRRMHFWMKNTPHPLSIAYINSAGIIKEIYNMKPYSLETVSSKHSVRYALEVPQGMFKRMNIEIGDKITKESLMLLKRKINGGIYGKS